MSVANASAARLRRMGYADVGADAPAQSARKSEWVDHAVSLGLDRDEADALTKDELIDGFS